MSTVFYPVLVWTVRHLEICSVCPSSRYVGERVRVTFACFVWGFYKVRTVKKWGGCYFSSGFLLREVMVLLEL